MEMHPINRYTATSPLVLTLRDFSWDSTLVDATTWSDGTNASNVWTFANTGTNHTMTASSALMTFSHGVTVAGVMQAGTNSKILGTADVNFMIDGGTGKVMLLRAANDSLIYYDNSAGFQLRHSLAADIRAGTPNLSDVTMLIVSGTTFDFQVNAITTTGVVTAEQLTSTDDITMQGHLLTLGNSTATPIIFTFRGDEANGNFTYTEFEEDEEIPAFIFDQFLLAQTGFKALTSDGGDVSSTLTMMGGDFNFLRDDAGDGNTSGFGLGPGGMNFTIEITTGPLMSFNSIDMTFDASNSLKIDCDNTVQIQSVAGGPTTIGGKLTTNKGRIKNTTRATTTYQILVTDEVVFANTDGSAWTATLPVGAEGQTLKIVNSGSSGNILTIAPNGAEHLLGVNSNFILFDGEALLLAYNATDGWY